MGDFKREKEKLFPNDLRPILTVIGWLNIYSHLCHAANSINWQSGNKYFGEALVLFFLLHVIMKPNAVPGLPIPGLRSIKALGWPRANTHANTIVFLSNVYCSVDPSKSLLLLLSLNESNSSVPLLFAYFF